MTEETLLSQTQSYLDSYLSAASLPNTLSLPSILGVPIEPSRDFNLLELSNLILLKCSHLFATAHDADIWPLLSANLELATVLTSHPAITLDYFVGMAIRDNTLFWLGHAIQARASIVDANTIRKVINAAQQTRATLQQILRVDLVDAISAIPNILKHTDHSDPDQKMERRAFFAYAINMLDHPGIPCKKEPADIIGVCRNRDNFQKHTKEDDTVMAGLLLVLDLTGTYQQTGHWPPSLEGPSAQMFEYTLDGNGFVLKTREEEPKVVSASLGIMESPTPTLSPPPARDR